MGSRASEGTQSGLHRVLQGFGLRVPQAGWMDGKAVSIALRGGKLSQGLGRLSLL